MLAASSLPLAVVQAWYLEDAAQLELDVRAAGLLADAVVLRPDECVQRATMTGRIVERMWDWLTAGDPEID